MADERRHAPRDDKTSLLVIAKMHEPKLRTLKLISYPDRRHSLCHVKTTNLLGAVLASNEAHNAEADEAVLLRGEYVTECAHSNISIIKDSVLITHPLDEHILPGIMRERLIIAAKGLDISVSERPFSYSELLSADDVIVSSTTRLAERATELDGIEISRGNHQTGDALMAILRKEWELFCSN